MCNIDFISGLLTPTTGYPVHGENTHAPISGGSIGIGVGSLTVGTVGTQSGSNSGIGVSPVPGGVVGGSLVIHNQQTTAGSKIFVCINN